jgi:HK97 gp10 family phage protein
MSELRGAKELQARLAKLAVKDQGKIMRKALAAATKPAVSRIRGTIPRKSGTLAKNIYATRSRSNSIIGAVEASIIGVRKITKAYADTVRNRRTRRAGRKYKADGAAFYWRFLEFGTKHIKRRDYISRGFNASKSAMLSALTESLRKWLDKATA